MASRLPVEVVTHIMRFLSLSDRKDAALVCRTWYEASLDPVLQRDITVHFYASTALSGSAPKIPSLSRRKLPHLVLNDFDSTLDAKAFVLKSCEHLASNLKSLSLKGSNITETTFVDLLSKCTSLVSLDLSCCNSFFMSGALLEKQSDLQALQSSLRNVLDVNLSSIRYLSDVLFNRIVTVCENVEKVSIAGTQLTVNSDAYYNKNSRFASASLLTFKNFLDFVITQQCLTSLNLSKTQIEDENIEELVSVPNLQLQELILVGCRNVSDEGIAFICKHQPQLKSLDIRECPDLTNASLMSVCAKLSQLKNLYMNKCKQISDKSVAGLQKLRFLEILDLSECSQVSSLGLTTGLCQDGVTSVITHLNLNCCSLVSDDFILQACEAMPMLEHLDLGSCFKITDISIHAISRNLKYLRFLRLAWCKDITDLGLLGLTKDDSTNHHIHDADSDCKCSKNYTSTVIFRKPTDKLKKLENMAVKDKFLKKQHVLVPLSNLAGLRYLDVTACKKISDTSLTQVVKFPEIRFLSLGMLPDLTTDGVAQIVRNNPSIEELNLSQCGSLTDATMATITTRLKRLQSLNIFGCDKLTDKSVGYIRDNCARLKHLDVSFCGNITMDAIERLETKSSTLVSVQKRMIGI